MLPHVGPHYTHPFQELLQCDGVFDVLEQLLAFLCRLHIFTRRSTASFTILSIGSKMELGFENTIT